MKIRLRIRRKKRIRVVVLPPVREIDPNEYSSSYGYGGWGHDE